MRILHLITRMDGGGSAVNTLLSAHGQQAAGHTVTLAFGPSFESAMSKAERQQVEAGLDAFREVGGHVVLLDALHRSPGPADLVALQQIRELLKPDFDIVHTHTSKAGALGRLAAGRLRNKRRAAIVHTPHGHIFHGYFGGLSTRFFLWIERWLARRSDALVALTRAERDDHLRLGVGTAGQWHVVPSGIDVAALAGRVEQLRGDDPGIRWQAVSVGRLVPVKGMERLVAAWREVLAQRPGARLAIVGDGPERTALEQQAAALGIAGQVHFAGWAEPAPYLAAADCFCLLSHNEGMGRAVVEAMAAGLPCVVADVCGLSELVDDSVGHVVAADDPKAVAKALLSDWPDSMRQAARQRAEAYSLAAMLAGLEQIYAGVSHAA